MKAKSLDRDMQTPLGISPKSCSIQRVRSDVTLDNEIAECFTKLKDLVPTVATETKVSKVQILQHVIDYILDLECTLQHHPVVRNQPHVLHSIGKERRPLAESSQVNTSQPAVSQTATPTGGTLRRSVSC